MNFRYKTILLLIFSSFIHLCWCESITLPYISQGIQIGINSKDGLFLGPQLSIGLVHHNINNDVSKSLSSYSICYGIKIYKETKKKETFVDFQIMYNRGKYPLSVGVGRKYYRKISNFRLKLYTWNITSITYGYDFKSKSHNISSIPIFPIFNQEYLFQGTLPHKYLPWDIKISPKIEGFYVP